jgi:hypothetical protein
MHVKHIAMYCTVDGEWPDRYCYVVVRISESNKDCHLKREELIGKYYGSGPA